MAEDTNMTISSGTTGTETPDNNGTPDVISEEEKASAVRLLFNIIFEHIVPWGQENGDTGLSSRLKLYRNFEKIKAWIDASPTFFLSKIYDDIAFGHITFNKGITTNGYTDDLGVEHPGLEVKGDSTFTGSLSTPEFISSFFGGQGWAIRKEEVVNSAGVIEYKYHLEIDDVTIRNTLRVFEMIISQLMGENANRYFSDMLEVDHYDPETGRIWLKTSNGRLYNPFRVGDLIEVQQYNDDPSEANDWYVTKHYELRITAAGLGDRNLGEDRLDWVEFDNFTTTMENGTPATLIQEHDTLVRADNDRNSKRKGLVSVMAIGENTPYIDVLYGQKTDPQHALKSRMGNLEGIHTDLFGWLEGFGLYVNNLYGVGKFFNYQTGESLSASIRMTRELFKSVYSETVYNINEDDNFLSNGFFQHDLEDWTKCATDGSAAPADSETEMLGTVEEAGGNSAPILVNGTPISVSNKVTAQTEDKDGIRVLHLYGMGVAQDFSKIKANGTHKEMVSSAASSTETKNVADKLYMGVRILPVTAGKLRVYFKKASGGYTGWERDIISDINWQLYQSTDNSDSPWDYTGSGKLIVSYTGECYIRFVALTTNAVANSKEEYSTLFEQNSRHITLRANKISSDLTEAVADFTIKYDSITQTVTDNKSAADRAFQTLTTDLNAETSARQSLENQWHATWVYQNDRLLSLMAAEFNNDGTIKGYADLKVQVSGLSSTVTDNFNLFTGNIRDINDDLSELGRSLQSAQQTLQDNIDAVDQRVRNYNTNNDNLWAGYATWKNQTDTSVASFASALTVDGRIGSLSSVIQSYNSIEGRVSSVESTTSRHDTDLSTANNNITSLTERVGNLEITDSNITGRVSTVETTVGSHTRDISDLNGSISGLDSELSGVEGDISSLSSRISTVEITSNSISSRVSAIESRPLNICDVDFWEQGSTDERTGYSYDQIKVSSGTRIRTKGLYPATDATACFMSSYGRGTYNVGFVYFTAGKVVCSTPWKGWETLPGDTKKISVDPPSDCAFIAVLLKRMDNGNIDVSEVKNTGITITSDDLVTSAEISTFISDEDGVMISHAKVKADRIDFQTDGWTVTNNDGDTTFYLDREGNLFIAGQFHGEFDNTVTIGKGTKKMYIEPLATGARLVGKDDDDETLQLAFSTESIRIGGTYQNPVMAEATVSILELNSYVQGSRRIKMKLSPGGIIFYDNDNSVLGRYQWTEASVERVHAQYYAVKSNNSFDYGADGSFTVGGRTVTVKSGIITNIS